MSTTEENECCYRKYCVLFKQGVLHESLKEIFFPFINKKYDNYTNKESRKKTNNKNQTQRNIYVPKLSLYYCGFLQKFYKPGTIPYDLIIKEQIIFLLEVTSSDFRIIYPCI